MSSYQQRALRVEVSFPLEFRVDGHGVQGMCENLSESGLLARFAEELEVWVEGEVDLHIGTDLLGVRVRVARVLGLQAGLAFQFSEDEQRQKVQELIAQCAKGRAV